MTLCDVHLGTPMYSPSVVFSAFGSLVCALDSDGSVNSYETNDFYRLL